MNTISGIRSGAVAMAVRPCVSGTLHQCVLMHVGNRPWLLCMLIISTWKTLGLSLSRSLCHGIEKKNELPLMICPF